MSDLDIVVKAEDKLRAHTVLLELGFDNTQQQDCEWVYRSEFCELELHHRLLYGENSNTLAALRLADRMWDFVQPVPGSSRYELSPEFHFLFLVMHLKKHVVNSGAGFRQFMDLAIAAQKWHLDWTRLEAWLSEAELRTFAEVCLTLCRRWFRLPLPLAGMELVPKFEEKMLQQIFSNGVYGYDNKEHRHNFFIARINVAGGDGWGQRLRMCQKELMQLPWEKQRLWQVLFPSYDDLHKRSAYRFVNHRPWLLPVAWIYRFIHCFWFKLTQVRLILLLRHSTVRKRNETLQNLGISTPPEN